MEGLEDVKKELEAKRQELALKLESAMGQVAAIENDMQRVDDALRVLTKKTKSRARSKKTAPAAGEEAPSTRPQELGSSTVDAGGFSSGMPSRTSTPFDQNRFGHGADEDYERQTG